MNRTSRKPMSPKSSQESRKRNETTLSSLYTKFCISVELGEHEMVKTYLRHGIDPSVTYSLDGVLTTPIHTTLKRGDIGMSQVILDHPAVQVEYKNLQNAPRFSKSKLDRRFIEKLAHKMNKNEQTLLIQAELPKTTSRAKNISLLHAVKNFILESESPKNVQKKLTKKPTAGPASREMKKIKAKPVVKDDEDDMEVADIMDSENMNDNKDDIDNEDGMDGDEYPTQVADEDEGDDEDQDDDEDEEHDEENNQEDEQGEDEDDDEEEKMDESEDESDME